MRVGLVEDGLKATPLGPIRSQGGMACGDSRAVSGWPFPETSVGRYATRGPEARLRSSLHRARGFTLIELMLAVAVLGTLAALALPNFTSHLSRADRLQVTVDIRQLAAEIQDFEGENGRYPDNLAEIGQGGMQDAWGNPYEYLNIAQGGPGIKGQVRKDKFLNPINSDFDLYSKGPDGQSKTQVSNKLSLDDVIRANDGEYVGLASSF